MEKKDIIVVVAVILGLGMSLISKYLRKKKMEGSQGNKNTPPSSSFPGVKDDYEPYSKK